MPNLLELPDVLRAAGLTVRTLDSWATRTTASDSPGAAPFHPRAVVWHHDASAPGDSPGVPAFMVRNYASAGAQLWVDRHGTWTVLSCRKANHAGVTLPGMPTNATSYGIETDHTTGEDWPADLLASLRRGTVAILRWLGCSADDLHFHRTICSPPGRKGDPDGLDLGEERRALRACWTGGPVLPAATLASNVTVAPGPRPVAPAGHGVGTGTGALVVDGERGPATTRAEQDALNTRHGEHLACDGERGPATITAEQRLSGARPVDGIDGPASRRALQTYLGGLVVDGVFGPASVRRLQTRLNDGSF